MTDSDLSALAESIARLDGLIARSVKSESDLKSWQREAGEISQMITQFPGASDEVPESLWHFLSDADLRFADGEPVGVPNANTQQDLSLLRHRLSAALGKRQD